MPTKVSSKSPRSKSKRRNPASPTKYNPEIHPVKIKEFIAAGKTKVSIAAALGIHRDTLNEWEHKHADVSDALKKGKAIQEDKLVDSMFKSACGHTGEDGRYYPPNATMVIFGLKNINPKDWRDKHEVVAEVSIADMTEEQLNEKLTSLLNDARYS